MDDGSSSDTLSSDQTLNFFDDMTTNAVMMVDRNRSEVPLDEIAPSILHVGGGVMLHEYLEGLKSPTGVLTPMVEAFPNSSSDLERIDMKISYCRRPSNNDVGVWSIGGEEDPFASVLLDFEGFGGHDPSFASELSTTVTAFPPSSPLDSMFKMPPSVFPSSCVYGSNKYATVPTPQSPSIFGELYVGRPSPRPPPPSSVKPVVIRGPPTVARGRPPKRGTTTSYDPRTRHDTDPDKEAQRKKNNEAVRKSREKAKMKEQIKQQQLEESKAEMNRLDKRINELEKQLRSERMKNHYLQQAFDQMVAEQRINPIDIRSMDEYQMIKD